MITSAQIVAARKLLGWPRDRLAPKAGVSATVLRKIEHGVYAPSNEQLLGIALERAGVAFTADDAPSVKLRRATKRRGAAYRHAPKL